MAIGDKAQVSRQVARAIDVVSAQLVAQSSDDDWSVSRIWGCPAPGVPVSARGSQFHAAFSVLCRRDPESDAAKGSIFSLLRCRLLVILHTVNSASSHEEKQKVESKLTSLIRLVHE